jgi:hypothetical protein
MRRASPTAPRRSAAVSQEHAERNASPQLQQLQQQLQEQLGDQQLAPRDVEAVVCFVILRTHTS